MRSFKYFRAKDPVLAAVLALGLAVSLPALTRAEVAKDWEEVGPAEHSVRQQLLSAPPIVSAVVGDAGVRSPVELPKTADVFNGENQTLANADEAESGDENVSADAGFYNSPGGSYTIQRGDTLGKIAKRLLGSSQKWRDIAVANPHINANKLNVGETIVIPGSQPTYGQETYTAPNFVKSGYSAPAPVVQPMPQNMNAATQSWQSAAPLSPSSVYGVQEPATSQMVNRGNAVYNDVVSQPVAEVSAPSFDPPPLLAPPPSPTSYGYSAPTYSGYGAPVYNSAPPPPQNMQPVIPTITPSYQAPPQPPIYSAPASVAPYSGNTYGAYGASTSMGAPVAVSTRNLYREERYRIPDELKPTDFTPYFNNINGYYGLFEVESALLPYIPTWDLGLHMRHRKYQYLDGEKNVIEGTETYIPLHLTYAYRKMFIGATVPFQSWDVKLSGGGQEVSLSGLHDPSLKFGYQVWKNLEGSHAVVLHAETKFSGGNYHNVFYNNTFTDLGGKSKTGSVIGPAYATRGTWMEIGGAYSGRTNEKWSNHLNMSIANNSEDSILKMNFRLGTDYRVNRNFSVVGEINSTSYETDNVLAGQGKNGTNVDLLLGFVLFNDQWQASLGFPIAVQKDWWYYHDFGVTFGINARWD